MTYDSINKKYIYAFLAILSLTAITQVIIQMAIYEQKENSQVINIAGKQRMFSQKLMKHVLQKEMESSESTEDITNTLKTLKSSHLLLRDGSTEIKKAFNKEIYKDYVSLGKVLDKVEIDVQCFLNSCRPKKIILKELDIEIENYLFSMNQIVKKSEVYAKESIIRLAWIELFIFILILVVFSFEFFKVFLPLKQFLLDQINELKLKDKKLRHQAKLVSIGQIASGVAHEVNNPLTIASATAELLTKKIEKGDIKKDKIIERLNTLIIAHKRIDTIIKGMKNFSRIDTDFYNEVSINSVILETKNLVNEIYEKEGIKLRFLLPPDELKCIGNAGELQQILMNLLSNAKDATENKTKPEITVKLSLNNPDQIDITVKDNGIGIPPEKVEKVLQPFYTTKEINKGSGMGLSIATEIITKMRGSISISSKVDEGTEFKITLEKV